MNVMNVKNILALADHLDQLAESKFDLNDWVEPDPSCKTKACIGGWAVMLFDPQRYKAWESAIFESDKAYEANPQQRGEWGRLADTAARLEPDWFNEARQLLGLDEITADTLFVPGGSLWNAEAPGVARHVTNKDAALALRVLAKLGEFPRLFDYMRPFNREAFQTLLAN